MVRKDQIQKYSQSYVKYSTLGLNIGVAMVGLPWLGSWLDKKSGAGQLFSVLGLLLGLTYLGYQIWLVVRDIKKKPANEKK